MTKPYEVAGKTRAEAEALAARQGLSNPVFMWISNGLYVLRFETNSEYTQKGIVKP